jgi:hypothetical protein
MKIKFTNLFKIKKSVFYYISFFLIILGFVFYTTLIFHPTYNNFKFFKNDILSSNLGNSLSGLVGTLFSLAGILLIIETLISQTKMFEMQRFESKYFELIKIHRNNIDNLIKRVKKDSTWQGRQVFIEIYDELKMIMDSINELCNAEDLTLTEIQRGGIAYTLLYFGIGHSSEKILKEYIKRHYFDISQSKLLKIIDILKTKKKGQYNTYRFEGHQMRLGQYYRHLYQTVDFVHNNINLKYKQKYNYIKTLRAQLSTHEQSLLFFNSLSVLGANWRIKKILSDYKLIKNLPPEFTFGINPKSIYPDIIFEYEE